MGVKIDEKVIVEAIANGLSYKQAGALAGSEAKHPSVAVRSILKKHSWTRESLLERLKEKRLIALEAINSIKANAESFSGLVKAVEIMTERIENLEGRGGIGINIRIINYGQPDADPLPIHAKDTSARDVTGSAEVQIGSLAPPGG